MTELYWYRIRSSERLTEYLSSHHVVSFSLMDTPDGQFVALLLGSRGAWHIVGGFADEDAAVKTLTNFGGEAVVDLQEVSVSSDYPDVLAVVRSMGLQVTTD